MQLAWSTCPFPTTILITPRALPAIDEERIVVYITFLVLLALCELPTASFMIWTLIAESICKNDNRLVMSESVSMSDTLEKALHKVHFSFLLVRSCLSVVPLFVVFSSSSCPSHQTFSRFSVPFPFFIALFFIVSKILQGMLMAFEKALHKLRLSPQNILIRSTFSKLLLFLSSSLLMYDIEKKRSYKQQCGGCYFGFCYDFI